MDVPKDTLGKCVKHVHIFCNIFLLKNAAEKINEIQLKPAPPPPPQKKITKHNPHTHTPKPTKTTK